jgi:phosphoribosylformimino-5-aminoimidazole carboxamide ribotide isomerase
MGTGPNLEQTQKLAESVNIPIIASGGVHTIQDIENLLRISHNGIEGVITGRAIYAGTLNLEQAISFVQSQA